MPTDNSMIIDETPVSFDKQVIYAKYITKRVKFKTLDGRSWTTYGISSISNPDQVRIRINGEFFVLTESS